ncbi:hypothetical protein UFOVP1328_51 [uncultured Caudovirales phage]|uniref:Uncharacterized protein n=1 Tax=uncultured Caudovirales phage TaxID=2100421 RepID=A0A6J5QDU6_9CAUD|nr:hypothetical protein UFOVP1084_27 [uncultured Caudovirales phage]CAB4199518.1 hypothetical protein UFOVP1328_51 [uncultured Caudovirales phage]CAB5228324.1 hypothetical protein UFOVP1532_19 [uncultured Caudovirales phage]
MMPEPTGEDFFFVCDTLEEQGAARLEKVCRLCGKHPMIAFETLDRDDEYIACIECDAMHMWARMED